MGCTKKDQEKTSGVSSFDFDQVTDMEIAIYFLHLLNPRYDVSDFTLKVAKNAVDMVKNPFAKKLLNQAIEDCMA